MATISQKTLETIKKQRIEPKPRWEFIFKNLAIWGLFVVALIVEGVLVSIVVSLLAETDFDIYTKLEKNLIEYVLIILPYFWLIALGVVTGLIVYNYRKTKHGYRLQTYLIVSGSVVVGVIVGTVFYVFGLGGSVEQTLAAKVPYYDRIVYSQHDVWNRPHQGLLAGEILEVRSPQEFLLRDFKMIEWTVRGENIIWRSHLEPRPHLKIKVIGERVNDHVFTVYEVRPWRRRTFFVIRKQTK